MERTDISVARFPDHTQAEVAVKALAPPLAGRSTDRMLSTNT